jgi:hypothetical protein
MPRSDLSPAEQEHVRALLRMLRAKLGSWRAVQHALPLSYSSLWEVTSERAEVSAMIAFRVARLLDVSLHHVLTGEALPPGTCRHCGHPIEE